MLQAATMPAPNSPAISADEWAVRVNLAAAYRLVALFGWDDLVFTHISAKVPDSETFLINPYGCMFEEITATSLVKVDQSGNKVGESPHDINPAGFMIHSCIHRARADAVCVLHTHSMDGVAVSAQAEGLRPLSQFALTLLHSLSYHSYEGFALTAGEQTRLVADLGQANSMILRNHGLLTVGVSIADAFLSMHRLEAACRVQLRAQSGGYPLIEISSEVQQTAKSQIAQVRGSLGVNRIWPGLLRRLDRAHPGYDS
jgi:ribulose-5-phosphate 4-epimerase/fuculose-1-phosphate aldolase